MPTEIGGSCRGESQGSGIAGLQVSLDPGSLFFRILLSICYLPFRLSLRINLQRYCELNRTSFFTVHALALTRVVSGLASSVAHVHRARARVLLWFRFRPVSCHPLVVLPASQIWFRATRHITASVLLIVILACFSLRLDRKMNATPKMLFVRFRPSFPVLGIGLISLTVSFTATTP